MILYLTALLGFVLFVSGVSMMSVPAGLMVTGAGLLWIARAMVTGGDEG